MPIKEGKKQLKDLEGNTHNYYVRQLPADQGEILKFKLIKMVGPSLSKLGEVKTILLEKSNEAEAKKIELFVGAITELFDRNEPEKVMTLLKHIIFTATRDGERISDSNFDIFYTNNMLEFYQACFFILQINFEDFLKGLKLKGKSFTDKKTEEE